MKNAVIKLAYPLPTEQFVATESSLEPLPQPKTFRMTIETHLKHSNATQNVYFSNFFEWQGAARERWFFECIAQDMLQTQGVFITKQAHNEFVREVFPFQTLTCELNAFAIQRCSFFLMFRFFNEGQLVSKGYQQILFANKQKKISKLPVDIITKIQNYACQPGLEKTI